MSKLYLGFWKNLSYLESTERAAIVLALKPVRLFIILLMLLLLRRILVKLIFWIINTIHELISSGKSFEARATSINWIAERYETVDAKVNNMHSQRWIVGILLIITAYYLMQQIKHTLVHFFRQKQKNTRSMKQICCRKQMITNR